MSFVPSDWQIMDAPGYAGTNKGAWDAARNALYGAGNWTTAFRWGEDLIDRDAALVLYEEAYLTHFQSHPERLDWLCATASEVYDNSPSNVASGMDYAVQETEATHLQDIAVRRCLLGLNRKFEGNHLVEIRGRNSEGYVLNPGRVPFHMPEMIEQGEGKLTWIEKGSIEDFWQSNKVLVVRRSALRPILTVDVIVLNEEGRVLLIDRATEPTGWALPGGKLEYGESLRDAAVREIKEETGLEIEITDELGVYDSPDRDPRHHMVSVVFSARVVNSDRPSAGDGTKRVRFFSRKGIPDHLVFDHQRILHTYFDTHTEDDPNSIV